MSVLRFYVVKNDERPVMRVTWLVCDLLGEFSAESFRSRRDAERHARRQNNLAEPVPVRAPAFDRATLLDAIQCAGRGCPSIADDTELAHALHEAIRSIALDMHREDNR